jgi:8-oxo-dGTP pyrophosphatase MutT (NUDIX family)
MLRVVSGALFVGNSVLLGLRKPTVKRPNLWELPGGKVEANESLEEALRREWHEELGIHVDVGDFIHTMTFDLEMPFSVNLFIVRSIEKPIALDHTEIGFFYPYEAVRHQPCAPSFYCHYPFLKRWLAEERTISDSEYVRAKRLHAQ